MAVQRVQEWLSIHGFATVIDGKYGPATARSVGDFQVRKKLPRTGAVTDETWLKLVDPLWRALRPPAVSRTAPFTTILRKVAEQHVSQRPIEVGGANGGPWVRLYCDGHDGPEWLWCAGFVSFLIKQAAAHANIRPPIGSSVSCDTLAAFARDKGRFVSGSSLKRHPERWQELGGTALFLSRRTATDWVHTGLALDTQSVPETESTFVTIEGNTNQEGGRNGFEACYRVRTALGSNYDFIRLD